MPDIDRLLEAEQSIHAMATELSRMRDAANLLSASQTQVEQVLESAQSIITTTKNFADQCGTIISRLSSTELSQMAEALNRLRIDLTALLKLSQANSESARNEARNQSAEVIQLVTSQFTGLQQTIQATDTRLTKLQEYTKSSQTAFGVVLVIVMLLNIATLALVAFPLFLK